MLGTPPVGTFMHEMLLYVLGEPFSNPGLYVSVYEVPVLTTEQVENESVRPSWPRSSSMVPGAPARAR